MTAADFEQEYTARLRVLRHWQCPTCDSYYPLSATCGVCLRELSNRDSVHIVVDEPPPSGWRDRPGLL